MGRGGESLTTLPDERRGLDIEGQRAELRSLAERLDLDAYEVGGCMRDEFSGNKVKDIDVVVCGLTYDDLASRLRPEGGIQPLETRRKTGEKDEKGNDVTVPQLVGMRLYPVWGPKEGFEFALARTEIALGDGGHKDFDIVPDPTLTVEQDLERRDFTINAIARSLRDGRIYDPYNGREDIEAGLIRTVTPDSFRDDSLRILRVFPRMAKDGFIPSPETLEQMREHAWRLREQSSERVRDELEKTLSGTYAAKALRLARDIGLLQSQEVLPEFAACIGYDQQSKYHGLTCDEHILLAVERACSFNAPDAVRWAALLHDIGKPVMGWEGPDGHRHFYGNPGDRDQTKAVVRDLRARLAALEAQTPETKKERHQHKLELKDLSEKLAALKSGRIAINADGEEIDGRGHELVGGEMTRAALRRLACPNDMTDRVSLLVDEHMYNDDDQPSPKTARRFLARLASKCERKGIDPREFADELLLLRRCDRAAKHDGELNEGWDAELALFEAHVRAEKRSAVSVKELAVSGDDIGLLGFREREMGETMRELLKDVIGDPSVNTREALLRRVAKKAIREKRTPISAADAVAHGLIGRAIGQALDRLADQLAANPQMDERALRAALAEIATELAA